MNSPHIVDRSTWLTARRELLIAEKAFTAERERLSALRRKLPLVHLEKPYQFQSGGGQKTLADLFNGKRQLIVYHFMFGKNWEAGCPSCSFWADNYNGAVPHLAARDTALVSVSSAPLPVLLEYRKRMGWSFDWVSSANSDFNADFGVTFVDGQPGQYNYGDGPVAEEMPGISVFRLLDDDAVAHSYSTYARGLDMLNGTYHLLDLTPAGRAESGFRFPQEWVRRHDEY